MDSTVYQNPTVIINRNVGTVTDSYKNVWNNCEISISDEKRQILEWLSPMAPRERHRAIREGRVHGVGNWLLQTNEFEKWHTSEDQDVHPVLFCYGNPGVGKTYLSSLVIDTLCDAIGADNVAVACVYCDFHAHKEQSATGVLAAILKQVVAGVASMPQEITKAFGQAKRGVDGRALGISEICAMLIKSLSYLRRGFICIDALDELPTKHRPELWGSLQRVVRECPNARLFVTGRPHIQKEVKKYFPGYPELMPIKPTEEDIGGYLTMRLEKDSDQDAMDPQLEADILTIIPDKISGAFLLVSLVMDAILEDATIHQRRQRLHNMTNGLGLEEAYSTTLSRIGEQKGTKAKLGMEALMWISRSERPLKAQELCHALAVEVGTTDLNAHNVPSVRTLLSCTLGLVTIDEEASTARLIHFTLQEHLVAHPNLFTTAHSMMAEICLTYLNFQSICELPTGLYIVLSATPFPHYASCYWGVHARKDMTEGVKHLALRLLQRDGNHISAEILLRERSVDFLPWLSRCQGRNPNLHGFTGLHYISYVGITEIATDMVNMKRWDLNGRDSNGATPLIWATKYRNFGLARLLLQQEDANPCLSDNKGLTPLTYAAKSGHEGMVNLLLERGDVSPDSPTKFGKTPLSYAAESGYKGVVEILLERADVDPDSKEVNGWTPLSLAAGSGRKSVVEVLLQRGDVDPNSLGRAWRTPLSHAAISGHEGTVKILLEQGYAKPDLPDRCGRTPLSYAAGFGQEGVAKILLERAEVGLDSLDEDGRTPLSHAAEYRNEGVVKMLLERGGVNPSSSDKDGMTPLYYAAQSGNEGAVKMLLERVGVGPDSPDEYGRTPLSYAAGRGDEGVVKMLLERGDVNPASSDCYGRTPLSYAAEPEDEGVFKMLLERGGVNPGSSDKDGRTPLSYAAENGSKGVMEVLLGRVEVSLDSPDKGGRTPLSYATQTGNEGAVKMLLERVEVSLDSPDKVGRTPLSHAAEYGNEGAVKILLDQAEVRPDSLDKHGRTPLSYAAESMFKNEGAVRMLLERGDVNPDSSDEDGRTPLSYAAQSVNVRVVKMLLERRDVNPGSPDKRGRIPLSYAAEREDEEGVAKMLLERRDVSPGLSDKGGRTPLSYAAQYGNKGVVKMLLERRDVNPGSPDKRGRTPLSYAAEHENEEGVAKMLLERRDVSPGSPDKDGRTPLSYAAQSGNTDVAKMLLERPDVNPGSPDKDGRTPLSYAAQYGYKGVVKMLLERPDVNPHSPDAHGQTPLSLATRRRHNGVVSLLSESRHSSRRSRNTDVTQRISGLGVNAVKGVGLGPVSQREGAVPDTRNNITEAISSLYSGKSPSNPQPPAPTLTPTPTSHTAPNPAILKPPMSRKRDRVTPASLRRAKRKRLSSS